MPCVFTSQTTTHDYTHYFCCLFGRNKDVCITHYYSRQNVSGQYISHQGLLSTTGIYVRVYIYIYIYIYIWWIHKADANIYCLQNDAYQGRRNQRTAIRRWMQCLPVRFRRCLLAFPSSARARPPAAVSCWRHTARGRPRWRPAVAQVRCKVPDDVETVAILALRPERRHFTSNATNY